MTLRLAIKSIESYNCVEGNNSLYKVSWVPVSAIVDKLPFNKIMEKYPKLNITYEGIFNDGKLLNYTIKGPKKLCNEVMISLTNTNELVKYLEKNGIQTIVKRNNNTPRCAVVMYIRLNKDEEKKDIGYVPHISLNFG